MEIARKAVLVLSGALLAGAAHAADPAPQPPAKPQAGEHRHAQGHEEHRRAMRGMRRGGEGCPAGRQQRGEEHSHS